MYYFFKFYQNEKFFKFLKNWKRYVWKLFCQQNLTISKIIFKFMKVLIFFRDYIFQNLNLCNDNSKILIYSIQNYLKRSMYFPFFALWLKLHAFRIENNCFFCRWQRSACPLRQLHPCNRFLRRKQLWGASEWHRICRTQRVEVHAGGEWTEMEYGGEETSGDAYGK